MIWVQDALPVAQTLVIKDWLPAPLSNGPHGHWSERARKLKAAQIMVWACGKQEGLQPIAGRARCTITLVFSVPRRRDTDNLYARVKGVVDGLVKGGWLQDDSTDYLDLHVRAEVKARTKETRIELEPVA